MASNEDPIVREDLPLRQALRPIDLRVEKAPAAFPRSTEQPRNELRFFVGLAGLLVVSTMTWLLLWALVPRLILGWSPVVITSGSMAPTIEPGDVVVASPYDGSALGPGTVVVFETGHGLVTHRIIAVEGDGVYVTKGDANLIADSTRLHSDQIVGLGRILVPLIGLPQVWERAGRWPALTLWLTVLLISLWVSRYALADRYDPWPGQRIPTHE